MKVLLVPALTTIAAFIASAGTMPISGQTMTTAPMTAPTAVPATTTTTVPAMSPTTSAPAPGGAPPMMMTMAPNPMGTLAIDARGLRARRTTTGFTLSGQALVKDACQAARFDFFPGNIFPPQFNLNQFRRPGTMGMLCIQRLQWVTATPRAVRAAKGQKTVTVHTQKRPSIVVPIQ